MVQCLGLKERSSEKRLVSGLWSFNLENYTVKKPDDLISCR